MSYQMIWNLPAPQLDAFVVASDPRLSKIAP